MKPFYLCLTERSRDIWRTLLGYEPKYEFPKIKIPVKLEPIEDIAKIMESKPLSHNEIRGENE